MSWVGCPETSVLQLEVQIWDMSSLSVLWETEECLNAQSYKFSFDAMESEANLCKTLSTCSRVVLRIGSLHSSWVWLSLLRSAGWSGRWTMQWWMGVVGAEGGERGPDRWGAKSDQEVRKVGLSLCFSLASVRQTQRYCFLLSENFNSRNQEDGNPSFQKQNCNLWSAILLSLDWVP